MTTTQAIKIDQHYLDLINPKRHPRYSPNFWRHLGSYRNRPRIGIYRDTESGERGQSLWIGYPDDFFFVGTRLLSALCSDRRNRVAAYIGLTKLVEAPEMLEKYLEIGRCAFDPEHRISFQDERWEYNATGNLRRCVWCDNHTQQLTRAERIIIDETWVAMDVATTSSPTRQTQAQAASSVGA
jgi:hypothetical protein